MFRQDCSRVRGGEAMCLLATDVSGLFWRWFIALGSALLVAACHSGLGNTSAAAYVPPTAQIIAISPPSPEAGQTISFSGTGSGSHVRLAWDFGDGTSAQGGQVSHVYMTGGTFPVTLTVIDDHGAKASASSNVVIAATSPPEPSAPPSTPLILTARVPPEVGAQFGFRASSTDPNGAPLVYTWTFGDGGTAVGAQTSHVFVAVGTYQIQVTATNPSGASATASTQITTMNAPVVPPLNPGIVAPPEVRLNTAYTYSGTAESTNGLALSYMWNFGDGSAPVTGQTVNHAYTGAASVHQITLTVTDAAANSASATAQVTVLAPQPPHGVIVQGPQELKLGESAGFSATFENPEGNPVTYEWNFGDGATSVDFAPSHSYIAAGSYVVSLTVTDTLTGSATGSMTLVVADRDPLEDLVCANPEFAGTGWCLAPVLPVKTALNAISFASANSGWIVGQDGAIIHSTDGGINWAVQFLASAPVLSVSAVDDAHAWALVGNGNVLQTGDGGQTWSSIASGSTFGLTALKFTDLLHGWAVGQGNGIVATLDGGQTWTQQNRDTSQPALRALDFADVNHGWAVDDGGKILATTDGGQTWNVQYQTATTVALKSVSFSDTEHGWVAGARTVLMTTDGGQTWTSVSNPAAETINAIKFINEYTGWIVTEIGLIYRTTDAGTTWQAQNVPAQTTGLPSMDALNANYAWIVSAGGALLVTHTGGQ